jgi:hypothetical protein
VSYRTSKGVPRYDDARDVFLPSGADEQVRVAADGATARFRPRTDELPAQINYRGDGVNTYWEVVGDRGERPWRAGLARAWRWRWAGRGRRSRLLPRAALSGLGAGGPGAPMPGASMCHQRRSAARGAKLGRAPCRPVCHFMVPSDPRRACVRPTRMVSKEGLK